MKQDLKATLETREKKDGSGTYQCIVIKLTPDYEKIVFLLKSESALVKAVNPKSDLPFGK